MRAESMCSRRAVHSLTTSRLLVCMFLHLLTAVYCAVVQAGSALSGHLVVQLCVQAVAVAVPAAFAAAPPLWFCVLCPGAQMLLSPAMKRI